MGESIAEGTIVRWIKKVGDAIDRDEPLFEISTDKVDAEIPSPASGVIAEIRAKEGETVPVNSVVAVISAAGEKPKPAAEPTVPANAQEPPVPASQADGAASTAATPSPQPAASAKPAASATPQPTSTEDALRERSSPLVRKIAKEHHVDISQIRGTGPRRTSDEGRHTGVRRVCLRSDDRCRAGAASASAPTTTAGASPRPAPPSQAPVPPKPTFGAGDVTEKCRRCAKRLPSTWCSAGARRHMCIRCSR
jgi:2-oxoglutarate dehydrogenase E2 component (dihydrolipoamide succinyltransferase)